MKYLNTFLVGLLTCALLVPPVDARPRRHGGWRGSSTAGIVLGVIAAAAAVSAASERHHHRYDPWRYGTYPVYGAPIPGRCSIPGAVTFIDEGLYRNYRDAYGNYLGRVPLHAIPPGYW